jgi:hypothetical protein
MQGARFDVAREAVSGFLDRLEPDDEFSLEFENFPHRLRV